MSVWDSVKDWERPGLSVARQIEFAKMTVAAIKSWCESVKNGEIASVDQWRKTLS
jgi:hypothetical protein